MGRRWLATDDFGPSSDPPSLVKSGRQMTTRRSRMTSVPWILVLLAFAIHHATSLPMCVDNGCSEQFHGLGGCVNLAAPLKIIQLSKRFDLGATSLKGLCGTVGCCHCMKLLHNSTEANSRQIKTNSRQIKTNGKEAWSKETKKTKTKETKTQEIQVKETQVKETKFKETQAKKSTISQRN